MSSLILSGSYFGSWSLHSSIFLPVPWTTHSLHGWPLWLGTFWLIFSCMLLRILRHVLKLVLWEPTVSNLLLFPSPLVILDDSAEVFKFHLQLFKAVLLIFIFGQFQPLFCYACDGFPIIFAKLLNAVLWLLLYMTRFSSRLTELLGIWATLALVSS